MDHIIVLYVTQSCKKVESKEAQHTFTHIQYVRKVNHMYTHHHLTMFGWPRESRIITVTIGGKERASMHHCTGTIHNL